MTNEDLVMQIQAGRADLMPQLWEQVAGLVIWKAKQILFVIDCVGGVEFDDLLNSGYLALVDAVPSYDPEKGKFSTWLMYHLKTAFAETTGYRTKRQQLEPIRYAYSLDAPMRDDPKSGSLQEVTEDPDAEIGLEAVEQRIYRQQLHEAMEAAVSTLPERQADIIRRRYYLDQTLAEIGQELGISIEAARKHERKALRELRQTEHASTLLPFYDFDYFCGTGVVAFRSSGMSVQERYLINQEKAAETQRRKRVDAMLDRYRMEMRQTVSGYV